ncbi:MAG TPA: amidase family protein, partial [Modicisalibacter sp.]|nr:amidase family protein [Modicisalibacter sp.]
ERLSHEALSYMPFTQLANLTGQPAMSVPLHRTAQGLPIGVQLIAAMGDDKRLLSLAGQLEQAEPWQAVSNLAY